jgi:hypothetical protein
MGALKDSLQSARSVLALAGTLVLLGLVAGSVPATGATTTPSNPASSALAPVSTQARPNTGGSSAASSQAIGATGGGTAAGTPAATNVPSTTTSVPTTTYAPPASSRIGTATPEVQRAGTTSSTTNARTPRRTSSSISTGAIALAALAALLALACVAWAVARWQAYEPRWTVSLRHAMAEAGFRASATWAEFTDWVRLGR